MQWTEPPGPFLCIPAEPQGAAATEGAISASPHWASRALAVVRILSEHPEGQRLLVIFGTYAGRLSFFPLSTFVMYK